MLPLQNERRKKIYEAVLGSPGIHMRELQRLTGIRWGALQYHAGVLVQEGLLTAARSGKSRVLACDVHRLSPEQLRAIHFIRGKGARKVAQAVAGRAVTQREVAEEARVSPALASRYLRAMDDMGLVKTHDGRPRKYVGNARLAELLSEPLPGRRSGR